MSPPDRTPPAGRTPSAPRTPQATPTTHQEKTAAIPIISWQLPQIHPREKKERKTPP